jgi:hypothetical protein
MGKVYHVTPVNAPPCLRQAGNLKHAIKRAAKEFPAGVAAVRPMTLEQLAQLAAKGFPMPVFVREQVKAILAAQQPVERQRKERREQASQPKVRFS